MKAVDLGLKRYVSSVNTPAAWKAIKMSMALALLPAEDIVDGFRCVIQYCQENHVDVILHDFLHYMYNFWLKKIGVDSISVCGLEHRSNNGIESGNKKINHSVGIHPNIWKFMGKL